jgi:hypothetical protein
MPTKREARRQRAEAKRAHQTQLELRRRWRSRALVALGTLALVATAWLVLRDDGGAQPGRVWSAEHGHFHDR